MKFQAKIQADDDARTVTIRLAGELDSGSAPTLNELIGQAAQHPVDRLVLLMDRLDYLSSAGLRCLVFAHQKFGPGVEIVLVGTKREVAETIQLTGLDRSVTMQDPADV
ncbi:MAG TPA: STAS domain-containing protein [Mycobacteriales bacterium]|jgi:anti-anti-sigma factor|nr:STAS domain-containing protein [Mycobacteriales bacterium]